MGGSCGADGGAVSLAPFRCCREPVPGGRRPGRDAHLRLPRGIIWPVLPAAGFALAGADAGAVAQSLADPYVLGISGGPGSGAMFAILIGLPVLGIASGFSSGPWGDVHRLWPGAWRRQLDQTRLLLTGVIVAAGCGALVALMLTIAPEHKACAACCSG